MKNIFIFGAGMLVMLLVMQLFEDDTSGPERQETSKKAQPAKKGSAGIEYAGPSAGKTVSPRQYANVNQSASVQMPVPSIAKPVEKDWLASARTKGYEALNAQERNALPREERIAKLESLVSNWESLSSSEQQKIKNMISMEWKTLPAEDQERIKEAKREYMQLHGDAVNAERKRRKLERKKRLEKMKVQWKQAPNR